MRRILLLVSLITTVYSYAGKGDILDTFTLKDGPANGVRGLEWDPDDSNIWATGPDANNKVIFCKFKNNDSHDLVMNWQSMQGIYWVYDIGYPYNYNGIDCLVSIDQNAPRLVLIKPHDGTKLGSLPDPYSSGCIEGAGCDFRDKKGVYIDNYSYTNIQKWNGSSWSNWATCGSTPMGIFYSWGHVFVVHSSSGGYKIKI
ncbi:MAG: hypothetical protein ACUVWP_01060 [bacterium]